MVQMESAFPFSHQSPFDPGSQLGNYDPPRANIFGSVTALFFDIPNNPSLRLLGEAIDDRLFKIRHSQDINGIFRKLPLFEPPIDPSLLVQAAAQGISLNSVINDLNVSMPNYRFQYLLARALELASECKSFGQALLAAKEKQDVEAYAALRAKHETSSQNLILGIKKLTLEEASRNVEALQFSRKGPEHRMQFFLQLAGQDFSSVPGIDAEFQAISEKLQKPRLIGGLMLLDEEREEKNLNEEAADLTNVVNALEALAGIFNALPLTTAHLTPL